MRFAARCRILAVFLSAPSAPRFWCWRWEPRWAAAACWAWTRTTPATTSTRTPRNIRSARSSRFMPTPGPRSTRSNWEDAAKQFNEVDRQHPYSVWARRAMLMSAFCSYQANKYGDAVSTADQYISLHPGSHEVAYAFYLKAISLYEQIVDVNRDQANTAGRAGGVAGRGAAFPRHRICPRRHLEDRPHPGSSRRQGDGGRPLLPDPRRLYRRHQPLPGGGRSNTRPRPRSPKRWSG